ncbi:MAG: hypothetical protein HY763_09710 [Planctomycetes bacterium]|nr:hypothetical protein [Planctomycetota bacterium]
MCNARISIFGGIAVSAAIGASTSRAPAECITRPIGELQAVQPLRGDKFGWVIAASEAWAVFGAPTPDAQPQSAGRAFVFRRSGATWAFHDELVVPDPFLGGEFGSAAAIRGDWIVVGAPGEARTPGDGGAAYVYRRDGDAWELYARLVPDDPHPDGAFGRAVAVDGDRIIVAAQLEALTTAFSGAVYSFRLEGGEWVQEAKLVSPAGQSRDGFGAAIALDGDLLVVGARRHQEISWANGAVYVFRHGDAGWEFEARLLSPAPVLRGEFGRQVALYADTLAVADAGRQDTCPVAPGCDGGTVLVYRQGPSGWHLEQTLAASSPQPGGAFGTGLVLGPDVLLAALHTIYIPGRAYLFRRTGTQWFQERVFTTAVRKSEDAFGAAIAISGEQAIIGAPGGGTHFRDLNYVVGIAYLFDIARPDCNSNGLSDAYDIATGASTDCRGDCVPDECRLADGTSEDCDLDGLPDECPSAAVELRALDEEPSRSIGHSVAIDGDVAVAGVWSEASEAGTVAVAYVFERRGGDWAQTDTLFAAGPLGPDPLGTRVSVRGDTILIGIPTAPVNDALAAGVVQVFARSDAGWTHEATLAASDGKPNDNFGWSVAYREGIAMIGAPGDDDGCGDIGTSCDTGAVYVLYRHRGVWTETQKLTVSGLWPKHLGASLGLSGGFAIAGCENYRPSSALPAAHVFRQEGGTWVRDGYFVLSGVAEGGSTYGHSVAISGSLAALGSYCVSAHTHAPCQPGVVRLFRRSEGTWGRWAQLQADDALEQDRFGYSLAMDGDIVLVGALGRAADCHESCGVIYILQHDGVRWIQNAKLTSPRSDAADFGKAVAIDGRTAMVGAAGMPAVPGAVRGSAQLFDVNARDCACPPGPVKFLDPPDGVIDARSPVRIKPDFRWVGIRTITVQAPPGAKRHCWSLCEVSPDRNFTNYILSAHEDSSGVYTIQLYRPLTGGAVVALTYRDVNNVATTGTFTSHPGNVNGDGVVGVADITDMIDYLNGAKTPPFGAYSADLNHSGAVNVQDLTAMINLHNGAWPGPRWFNTQRPERWGCP